MAKRATSKTEARAAGVNSRKPSVKLFPEARPMQEDEIEDLLVPLLERARSEPEDENGRIGSLLARQGLERICFTIADEAMGWAREDGESGRSDWAGRFLASLLIVLAKRSDWLAEKSQAFDRRKASLASLADLQAKRGDFSPYVPHLLRTHDRAGLACDLALLREAFGKDAVRLFPLSELEAEIPSLLAEAEAKPESRASVIFEKIIWPMLKAEQGRIEKERDVQEEMRKRMTETQRKPSFANLKKGFRSAWLTLYARPEGKLRGIERGPL
jgi:hypothetical protein